MLRSNVLVDCGPTISRWKSDLIVAPDAYKQINAKGKIVSIGSKCSRLSQKDVGREVVIGIIRDENARLPPESAKKLGLPAHWHFIADETKVICAFYSE